MFKRFFRPYSYERRSRYSTEMCIAMVIVFAVVVVSKAHEHDPQPRGIWYQLENWQIFLIFLIVLSVAIIYLTGSWRTYLVQWTEMGNRDFASYGNQRTQQHEIFLENLFGMFAKFCKADGRVAEAEIEIVDQFIKDRLKLQGEESKLARKTFRAARENERSFEIYCNNFFQEFKNNASLLRIALEVLEDLRESDAHPTAEEDRLLAYTRKLFGIAGQSSASFRSQTLSLDEAYRILNCAPYSSMADIKREYRRLCFENHPDQLYAQGLSPELIKVAQARFIKIREAYEKVSQQRTDV